MSEIRNLTGEEMTTLIQNGACTFCKGKVFRFGPRGGASLNIFCTQCGAGFNICVPTFPAQLIREPDWRKKA